ncbi:MAG: abortive infection family protein [Desulfomicrobium sp.]|uniref:abortive infection family protein n=1 Tax=Hoeflea sp. TaxID=1940281 RepID=UPI0025BC7A9C|nr:abortive infection family protein [Hoeflea sp.]MBV1711579.1 abortive infection family protein [Desulfomicrobium sp.]MBV1782303.1 abortive infection family protein [Hoeflea sp.]
MQLKRSQMKIIDDALAMGSGYVLNFSDRTFAEFFEDEFQIDIDDSKYHTRGTSKANRLRSFIEQEDEYIIAKVLRQLWQHRESLSNFRNAANHLSVKAPFFDLISRIEGGGAVPRTDAIERFSRDETLEELVSAIERDIGANRPAAALDRLHTYCGKKFGHLLDGYGVTWTRDEPLHSRVGKYVKALEQGYTLTEMSKQIIKNAISVFDKFNFVRNNLSLAHDNDLSHHAEARFIFDSVTALLRFVKAIEAGRYGA